MLLEAAEKRILKRTCSYSNHNPFLFIKSTSTFPLLYQKQRKALVSHQMRPDFVQYSKYLSRTLLTGPSDFISQTSTFSQEQNKIESSNSLLVKHSSNAVLQTLQRNPEETENKTQSLLLLIKNHLQLKTSNKDFQSSLNQDTTNLRVTVINSSFLLKKNLLTSVHISQAICLSFVYAFSTPHR